MNENIKDNDKVYKKRNGIAAFIAFLCLLVLVAGIYFAYTNMNKKDESKDNDKKEPEKVEEEILKTEQITFSECKEDKCIYAIKLGDKSLELIYEEVALDSEYEFQYIIRLGDEVIFDDDNMMCGSPAAFQVLDQAVIISYHYGCNIGGNVIVAYNSKGEEIFSYQNLDENYQGMYINGDIEHYFEISNKNITVSATRLTHDSALIINDREYYICEEDELIESGITDDTIVSGIYEITYEGNGKFSKPQLAKSTTFKEYMEKNPCQ